MLPGNKMDDLTQSDKTYKAFKIDFENKKIDGIVDGKEALEQQIKMVLKTQRYKYPVFSHSFGTDYASVFSEGYQKAMGKLKNALCDSLIFDERIKAVDNFSFERRGTKMIADFSVVSIYGAIESEIELKNE